MLSKYVTLVAIGFSSLALAQGGSSSSELPKAESYESKYTEGSYMFLSPKKQNFVCRVATQFSTLDYASTSNFNGNTTHYRSTGETKVLDLAGLYGLTDNLSLAVGSSYSQSYAASADSKQVTEGLSDPSLALLGKFPRGELQWISSISFTPGLGRKEGNYSTATRTNNSNNFSGGSSITAILGAETRGSTIWGLTATAALRDLSTSHNTTNNTDSRESMTSGGHEYKGTGYLESGVSSYRWGLELGIAHHTQSTFSSGDQHSSGTYYDMGSAMLYAQGKVTKDFDLIPRVTYSKLLNDSLAGVQINHWNGIAVQLNAVIGM